MSKVVTLLLLLSCFSHLIVTTRACLPNSLFFLNGHLCQCDDVGKWKEKDCKIVERRQVCKPGQVIWQGCNRCTCQEDGKLSCIENTCFSTVSLSPEYINMTHHSLNTTIPWCTPFRSYYVNCSICICPASGKTSEAHCTVDSSCTNQKSPSSSDLSNMKRMCLPKVMYLFPCLHCLCTDSGVFTLDKCVETCQGPHDQEAVVRSCIPKTFYRKDCNVCHCPKNGMPDDSLCTKAECKTQSDNQITHSLRSLSRKCQPHKFTSQNCYYCECNAGTMNENVCLEHECLPSGGYKYDLSKEPCSPGELVPVCMECFCLRSGHTEDPYCSRACSYQSKLSVVEKILHDSKYSDRIVDRNMIEESKGNEICQPDSVYIDRNRYCLCPKNGNTNFNLCTAKAEPELDSYRNNIYKITIDFNATCEPNTFVDFDCNTCFCSKFGKLDPKWCTYDDCDAKRTTMMNHLKRQAKVNVLGDVCHPGALSKIDCNFCICSDNGLVKHQVCTTNDCLQIRTVPNAENFICEPLTYYEVDCNVCFCPKDGVKNVAKCTKNHCEKSFLRSDMCAAGQLFSYECNVCVCPPNGNKAERACTNYSCSDAAPWKKIFQISESLVGNQITEDDTRSLDICFPGEEFIVGCKLCVCPDMGLKDYATCAPMLCEEDTNSDRLEDTENKMESIVHAASRRSEDCSISNLTQPIEEQQCTPGSIYFKRCKQCICPSEGNTTHFCRDLPKDMNCFKKNSSGIDFLQKGIENTTVNANASLSNTDSTSSPDVSNLKAVKHGHTKHRCVNSGRVMDQCFLCECDDSYVIEEHCFKSNHETCVNATPAFLRDLTIVRN